MITTEITLADKEQRDAIVRAFSEQPMKFCAKISNSVTSIREILDMKYPIQLSELNRKCPNQLKAVLVKFIESHLLMFGFHASDLSPQPIMTVINDILRKYYYLRIEDVCLCFAKVRTNTERYKGFYGNKVDYRTIMEWFNEYDKERTEALHSHPSNYLTAVDLSNGVTPYTEDDLLEMIAGGDLYANSLLQYKKRVESLFKRDAGVYKNYQYNRKHRFDDR